MVAAFKIFKTQKRRQIAKYCRLFEKEPLAGIIPSLA